MTRDNRKKIFIEGEVHSSKNSRRIFRAKNGQPFIVKSARSKDDESLFLAQLNSQRETWNEMIAGKQYPIVICFLFRRATHRRFDYVNIAQGILDAMVKAVYIPDDSMEYVIPFFLPYVLDRENPGCEITVKNE